MHLPRNLGAPRALLVLLALRAAAGCRSRPEARATPEEKPIERADHPLTITRDRYGHEPLADVTLFDTQTSVIQRDGAVVDFDKAWFFYSSAADVAAQGDSVRCWDLAGTLTAADYVKFLCRAKPTTSMLHDVVELRSSYSHVCGRRSDGRIECRGGNGDGQLGDGLPFVPPPPSGCRYDPSALVGVEHERPVEVVRVEHAKQLGVGQSFTCALDVAGAVWCWGRNDHGQLGEPVSKSRSTPKVVALPRSIGVAVGADHACAIDANGALRCWGGNAQGQLGDGSTKDRAIPTVVSLARVARVVAYGASTCAAMYDGSVYCFGVIPAAGALREAHVPERIVGLDGVVDLAIESRHACAVRIDDSVWCWGANERGELGDGTVAGRSAPVRALVSGVRSVAVGHLQSCAVLFDGQLRCWGEQFRQADEHPSYVVPTPQEVQW